MEQTFVSSALGRRHWQPLLKDAAKKTTGSSHHGQNCLEGTNLIFFKKKMTEVIL